MKILYYLVWTVVYIIPTKTSAQDTTVSFKVSGLCDLCKQRIEGALKVKGISGADWNVETKMLTVAYNPQDIDLQKINNRITAAGHDTYYKKAKDVVYNALPECCHYRDAASMETKVADSVDALHTDNAPVKDSSNTISGVVLEENNKGSFSPLQGATVRWMGTAHGVLTDSNGVFRTGLYGERLIVSYTGFRADTISVVPYKEIKIVLASAGQLKEVKVNALSRSVYVSALNPVRTETITQKELYKAACCNLSESFETNPSVDVSYNDAVTGSKQIQLLGLAGIYTQFTVENLPGPRGLATSLGLNFIPGTWIESIQMSKGTGSVANGFESIAGQINIDLKQPATAEKLYANIYANGFGKTDLNLNLAHKLNDKWSTELLLHDDFLVNKVDMNKDGFKDLPTGNLFTVQNKWAFNAGTGWMSQFGVRVLADDRIGGETNFNEANDKLTTNRYGLGINTKRYEVFGKTGYVFPEKKYKSMGLQLSAFHYNQDAYYGLTTYHAGQENFYSNLIYQSIISSTIHKFRTGISYVYDGYTERFNTQPYNRKEMVTGGFFEYTFSPVTKFDLVAGIREDYNNIYGWFTTPRLNLRYQPFTGTVIRMSVGRGQRTANIFAENNGVFVSSRSVEIIAGNAKGAYGLNPEVSWNKGITADQKFRLFHKAASFTADFFRNDFSNQVIVDLEQPGLIRFYNLKGKSYSNSFQTELSFSPANKFDIRLAYRLYDVKTTYDSVLLEKPLVSRNRAFGNFAYEINSWKFDYTVSFSGAKRLPSTAANPAQYRRENYSPGFVTMNAQVSKSFGSKNIFDVYIGAENLTNFIQHNAIIAADEPFNAYFDASMIWGPVTGRMIYGGLRFKIK